MNNLKLKSANGLKATVLNGKSDQVNEHSPARLVVTDFTKHTPAVVAAETRAEDAMRWLDMEKFPWQLVVGADQSIRGILVKGAEVEQKLMQRVANGEDRSFLTAKDIMLPLSSLHCLSASEVERANVGELLQALRHGGAYYCLVLDNELEHVRGLISAQDVIERLGGELQIPNRPTFVEIFNAVHP